MRLCRSIAFSSVAIACIWLYLHISIRAAEPTALFHPNPQHISNRLCRQLHERTDARGKEWGGDALDLHVPRAPSSLKEIQLRSAP
jgi:hypothetical protein